MINEAVQKLEKAVAHLGVTAQEVIDSPILDWPVDAEFVVNANAPYLRAYIASWLLANKVFPYRIHLDAVNQLKGCA